MIRRLASDWTDINDLSGAPKAPVGVVLFPAHYHQVTAKAASGCGICQHDLAVRRPAIIRPSLKGSSMTCSSTTGFFRRTLSVLMFAAIVLFIPAINAGGCGAVFARYGAVNIHQAGLQQIFRLHDAPPCDVEPLENEKQRIARATSTRPNPQVGLRPARNRALRAFLQ